MMESNLDKYLHTVRRIEEHREENAVKELQKLYKQLIKDLRNYMGNAYADYSDPETGKLTFADLHAKGLDARLLEEVAARMNEVTQKEKSLIKETVEEIYRETYAGMVNAVDQAANSDELHEELSSLQSIKPETVSAAVNNPVHGLTLTDQLEKHREEIVYGIKQAVGVGLSVGDNYTTMAKRIQTTLIGPDGAGGSYAKSVRIARTEAHRVRETGNLDAAKNLSEKLESAGYTMTKTWHTMKDERVRPQRRYKTKHGWKTGKPGKYNHVKMDGVTVPIDEKFKLPSGAETMAPGQSGVAGEDINCRCYLTYDIKQSSVTMTVTAPPEYGDSLTTLTKEDQKGVQETMEKAPAPVQNLWAKFGSQFKPVRQPKESGRAYFEPRSGYVYFGRRSGLKESNYQRAYNVYFHEFGHNIDHLAGGGTNFTKTWRSADGKSLKDIISEDCERSFKDYFVESAKDKFSDYDLTFQGKSGYITNLLEGWRQSNNIAADSKEYTKIKRQIEDAGESYAKLYKIYMDNADKFAEQAYNVANKSLVMDSFAKHIRKTYSLYERGDISDMFEPTYVEQGGGAYPFGVGHGKEYARMGKGETETFAEITAALATEPESIELIKKFMPGTYKAYFQIVEAMLKGVT